jgi:hypothetical protein
MNLALYALASISHLLVIAVLPDAEAGTFLRAYSLASMAFGVLVVYAFCTPRLIPLLQRSLFKIVIILMTIEVVSLVEELPSGQAISYSAAMLLADYYLTQSGSVRQVALYRCFLILSVVPALVQAYVEILPWQEWLVPIRIFGALVAMISIGIVGHPLTSLKLDRPILYIVATHIIYFGSLALIALWLSDPELLVWYLGTQIGAGLILKVMDFRIRRHSTVSALVIWGGHGISAAIGAVLALLYWQPLAFLTYTGALLGLNFIVRRTKFS